MNTPGAGIEIKPGDDLSALAWVNGELKRSLEAAHKALRRYLKEAEAAYALSRETDILEKCLTRLNSGGFNETIQSAAQSR